MFIHSHCLFILSPLIEILPDTPAIFFRPPSLSPLIIAPSISQRSATAVFDFFFFFLSPSHPLPLLLPPPPPPVQNITKACSKTHLMQCQGEERRERVGTKKIDRFLIRLLRCFWKLPNEVIWPSPLTEHYLHLPKAGWCQANGP